LGELKIQPKGVGGCRRDGGRKLRLPQERLGSKQIKETNSRESAKAWRTRREITTKERRKGGIKVKTVTVTGAPTNTRRED
jgi:hypothetical protein